MKNSSWRPFKFNIGDGAILALLLLIAVGTISKVFVEMGGVIHEVDQHLAAAAAHDAGAKAAKTFSTVTSEVTPR